jgi:hypothetical protein
MRWSSICNDLSTGHSAGGQCSPPALLARLVKCARQASKPLSRSLLLGGQARFRLRLRLFPKLRGFLLGLIHYLRALGRYPTRWFPARRLEGNFGNLSRALLGLDGLDEILIDHVHPPYHLTGGHVPAG